jgi:putative ABC transport system ATP-binding protein
VIRTPQLAYRYAGGTELRFPDVDVPQGAVLLLRGPSGAGKSTWLALVAGLLRVSSGQAIVAGQDLTALKNIAVDAWRARAIGFLPQKLHLSEALTVAGNLAMAQWAAGVPEDGQAVQQVLAALDVAALAKRKPSQLSGGQAQRVALARAVLMQPQLILADEPTASLDDDAAQAALALLQSHAQRCHATLVIATHDARVLRALPGAVHVLLQSHHYSVRPELVEGPVNVAKASTSSARTVGEH